jgi:hypothetical protein
MGMATMNNQESFELTSLAGSLQPLKNRFNSFKSKPRFLALMSPT